MRTNLSCVTITTILMLSQVACDNPGGPPSNDSSSAEFRVLGPSGATRVFSFAVAEFLDGTQTPTIVPPDSIRPVLQFPESLYTRGVFVYGQEEEFCKFRLDTFFVIKTEQGFNLYTILHNASVLFVPNGAYGTRDTARYVLGDGKNIYKSFGWRLDLVYQLPLQIGSVFTSSYSGAVTSIAGMDTITTPAGRFAAFRVEVSARWGLSSRETHWVNTDIGPVVSEYHYYGTTTYPWDTTRTVQVHQVRRRELVKIYL